ncbi:MAG: hypothetical protein KIT02_11970 [Devosia sp.]|uniref:hypothetical protein n=1 Tax=Devosia sp. TaxID=1871048 RepID=UPI0024CCBA65|nr:hypothetical protein [Devosia sp.]UYN98658.1 MAG: hypothetical protein KIT02_11970 [Devosia sp.]
MQQTHMLTRHRDIQNWVNDRHGKPAIARVRNQLGQERAQLKLHFDRQRDGELDCGMSPCSWNAWLAELDRQNLALRVDPAGRFDLVSRSTLN